MTKELKIKDAVKDDNPITNTKCLMRRQNPFSITAITLDMIMRLLFYF